MLTLNDLLVVGLCLLFLVFVLRLCGVRRIPAIFFIVLLFLLVFSVSIGWAYMEWKAEHDTPAYRSEWQNGTLEDLNGHPLDPAAFQGPYAE